MIMAAIYPYNKYLPPHFVQNVYYVQYVCLTVCTFMYLNLINQQIKRDDIKGIDIELEDHFLKLY